MNFDRFCGMASAATLLLVITLAVLKPAEWGTMIVNAIGWLIAIGAGYAAWQKSQEQVQIGQRQMTLQQSQIDDTRREIRRAKFLALDGRVQQLATDIDRLIIAKGYLTSFAERFPGSEQDSLYGACLAHARTAAADTLSASASSAPFGYGQSITTVMTRIQLIGDRMDAWRPHANSDGAAEMRFNKPIADVVSGIRSLAAAIGEEIPKRRIQLRALSDERDVFVDHAATH